MRPHTLLLTLGLATGAACGSAGPEPEIDPSVPDIQITVEKTAYTRAEVASGSGAGVRARIANRTGRTYYSRLGDAFNAAVEQDLLWVATGSDGALEREDGAGWVAVQMPFLVEGVSEVQLGAGKSYELVAHGPPAAAAGRYRIAVTVRGAPGGAAAERVVSAPFEVR